MRLLHTSTYELKEFMTEPPPYAILSHRWGSPDDEVSFKEWRKGEKTDTSGYRKIIGFCNLASTNCLEWVWVDTCCIDKRSSAELSEAINSMYTWYAAAKVCSVYLDDVPAHRWVTSRWWNRGWTLQELIAPPTVIFYDRSWDLIGEKLKLADAISRATTIPAAILTCQRSPDEYCVAQKMAWAANRETTRIEDRAYSLLGLFKIKMPMLYGEGNAAFQRLQIEILRKWADESVLAWGSNCVGRDFVLADDPARFKDCIKLEPIARWDVGALPNLRSETPPRATSWGIELRASAIKLTPRRVPNLVDKMSEPFLWAVTLTRTSHYRIQELPCTIVLTGGGPSRLGYQRYNCLHGSSATVLPQLSDQFKRSGVEHNKLFYLCFDREVSL